MTQVRCYTHTHTLKGCIHCSLRAHESSNLHYNHNSHFVPTQIGSPFLCKGNICLYNGFLPFPLFYWEAKAPLIIVQIYRLTSLWHFIKRPPGAPLCPVTDIKLQDAAQKNSLLIYVVSFRLTTHLVSENNLAINGFWIIEKSHQVLNTDETPFLKNYLLQQTA